MSKTIKTKNKFEVVYYMSYGLSIQSITFQKEKDIKSFAVKIEQAKQEILKYPPSHIFGEPGSNYTPQDNINLMKTRLNMMEQSCPTLAELIPDLFDPNLKFSIIYFQQRQQESSILKKEFGY